MRSVSPLMILAPPLVAPIFTGDRTGRVPPGPWNHQRSDRRPNRPFREAPGPWNHQRSDRRPNRPSRVERGRLAFRMTLEGLDPALPPPTGTLVDPGNAGDPERPWWTEGGSVRRERVAARPRRGGSRDRAQPSPGYDDRSPVMHARKATTPTLVIAGELDRCTPVSQGELLFGALAAPGCETELVILPAEGHVPVSRKYALDAIRRTQACSIAT
jgi:pimeloyl-ACP methyl ester carboxylesterase